ncbi:MAG: porin family protein [Devosia sp.]|uniref:outer membrane protein n=1 Tax=Devosia sp. TaxID=1871048 RepID=UPI0019E7489F|nr:outer membrane beta-barrel protein [Devosia sp.]MBF0680361.1 porin family protein [Devosia sp.]
MKRTLIALAALAGLASNAVAADLYLPMDQGGYTSAGFDWSGFYAGINAGYGSGTAESVGALNGLTDTINWSGGLLGVNAGVNAQFDNFVLGLEGDVAWSGINVSTACAGVVGVTCSGDINWLGTLRGRAGMAFDNVLLFATGGLAVGGVNANTSAVFAGATGSYSGTGIGYTIGAGMELALNDAISVKAEYSYNRLTGTAPAGSLGAQAYDVTAGAHVGKVGLNFHF